MKHRIPYADLPWFQAWERIKTLPEGTKLYAKGVEFTLDHVWDEPHPQRLELKYRRDKKLHTCHVRVGDPLLLELKSAPVAKTAKHDEQSPR